MLHLIHHRHSLAFVVLLEDAQLDDKVLHHGKELVKGHLVVIVLVSHQEDTFDHRVVEVGDIHVRLEHHPVDLLDEVV